MTEPLFLDTDCLSTFLIVQRENLILQLYAGRIGIPQQVYVELRKQYKMEFPQPRQPLMGGKEPDPRGPRMAANLKGNSRELF